MGQEEDLVVQNSGNEEEEAADQALGIEQNEEEWYGGEWGDEWNEEECEEEQTQKQDNATHVSAGDSEAKQATAKKAKASSPGKAAIGSAAVPAKLIKIHKNVAERVRSLNAEAGLTVPIRIGAIAGSLSDLDEVVALSILDSFEEAKDTIENPNAWIRETAIAAAGELAQAEVEAKVVAEATVKAMPKSVPGMIKRINRSGFWEEQLELRRLEGPFAMLSDAECLAILRELEASTEEIESPNVWVRKQAFRKVGRVMTQVDMLNRGAPGKIGLMEAIDPDKVRAPLSMIPEETSLEILRELDSKALEIEDPTAWIVSATEKHITPVAVKLHYINETLDLQKKVWIPGVLDALTEIDEAAALQILRKFENVYARIRNPTGWMRAQAQLSQYPPLVANKVMAKAPFFPGLRRLPGQQPMLRAPLSASRGQITTHMAANHAALAGERKRKADEVSASVPPMRDYVAAQSSCGGEDELDGIC